MEQKRPKDVPFWDSAKGQLVKKVRVLEHDVYPDGQVDLVASISNDILPTSYSFINRAHPYKLSEDVLKNIPMYNWESVANRIRNSFGISGGLGATGTYI